MNVCLFEQFLVQSQSEKAFNRLPFRTVRSDIRRHFYYVLDPQFVRITNQLYFIPKYDYLQVRDKKKKQLNS